MYLLITYSYSPGYKRALGLDKLYQSSPSHLSSSKYPAIIQQISRKTIMKMIILTLAALVAGASAGSYHHGHHGHHGLVRSSLLVEPTHVRIESGHDVLVAEEPLLPAYHHPLPVLHPAPVFRTAVPFIPITRFDQEIVGSLSDSTSFTTGHGIAVDESTRVVPGYGGMYEGENGELIKSDSSLAKSGSYSYTGEDGIPIAMSWVADELGFRATGAHLPTPPPMPAEIAESLMRTPLLASGGYGGYAAPAPLPVVAPVAVRISDYAAPHFTHVRASSHY